MSSTVWRIAQSRSLAARRPEATMRAGSPGRRSRSSGSKSSPVDPPEGGHDLEHRQAVAAAEVVGRLDGPAGLEGLRGGDVGEGDVADVDVVPDAGAVRGRVVRARDDGRAIIDKAAHHGREQVVRRDVPDVLVRRADDVEVAQGRGVQRGRGDGVVDDPLTHGLRGAVRRLRGVRRLLGDLVHVRRAEDPGARREHQAARRPPPPSPRAG